MTFTDHKKIFEVTVITNAKQSKIVEEADHFLKVKLTAIPEKGKANTELIKILAKKFDVSKSQIEIVKGLTTKKKLVRIEFIKSQK
ncbi:MAG: DUF167 domain-containing protein [Patescibacteria group bacterium]|nr:DUF167 domain-containing protein [Patescibacteria group bacterium]